MQLLKQSMSSTRGCRQVADSDESCCSLVAWSIARQGGCSLSNTADGMELVLTNGGKRYIGERITPYDEGFSMMFVARLKQGTRCCATSEVRYGEAER